jgi:hypothetical protein
MSKLLPHIVVWAALTTAVIFLAIYRRMVSGKTDELVHLADGETRAISTQTEVARKVAVIDRWGKTLTVIAAIYLLVIAGLYLYASMTQEPIINLDH